MENTFETEEVLMPAATAGESEPIEASEELSEEVLDEEGEEYTTDGELVEEEGTEETEETEEGEEA